MSKDYSYNKKKLKSRQGRAVYGLLGQQLGGMGAVMAGGTKGNILGRYAVGSVAGMGAGYLAGGHLPMSDNGSLDYTVERAIKKYKKTGKKNAAFRDLEKNYDLKLSKRAALENFYLVKEAGVGVSVGPINWTPSTGVLGSFAHPAPNKRDFNSYKKWKEMERKSGKSLSSRRYTDRALSGMTVGGLGGLAIALGSGYGAFAPLAALPAMGIGGLAGLGYAMYEEDPKG